MASNTESFAEAIAEFGKKIELMHKRKCVGVPLWNCLRFKLNLEAAHKREMEHRAIIAGVSLADAFESNLRKEIATLKHDIAKLRETLRQAIAEYCHDCEAHIDGKCVSKAGTCFVHEWRKVLEETK